MAWWQVGRRERAVQARERAVEARETVAGSYTDTLIQGLLAQAQGTVRGDPNATAAVEVAAGVWARALAAATVTPATSRTRAVTPSLLALVGREWMRVGEALFLLQVDARGLTLAPASTWDVWGESDESTWRYRLDVEGPSGNRTRTAYSAEVVHTRFAVDPRRPWKGLPPTLYASATAALLANMEQRLGQEAGGPVGHIIPVPGDAGDGEDDDPLASLKTALAKLNGGLTLLESTASGWDEDVRAAPKRDWQPQRFGADPPEHLVDLRSQAAQAVLAACGVPVALVSAADGTAQREAYRRFVMAALEPAAACLAEELSAKLEVDLSFDFGRLWAHDLAGRAQVFERLTRGKVPMERALRLAGIG